MRAWAVLRQKTVRSTFNAHAVDVAVRVFRRGRIAEAKRRAAAIIHAAPKGRDLTRDERAIFLPAASVFCACCGRQERRAVRRKAWNADA